MADILSDFNLDVAAEVEVDGSGTTSTPCNTTHGLNPIKSDNCSKHESDQLPKFSRLLPSRPTRPQMLGNLTFREIAGRRKTKTKTQPTRIKHEGLDVLNTSLSYLLLDSSECANKQQEKLDLRDFVGKTITLGPQNVSLKFVSNNSQSLPKSNGKLLKIDPTILFGKNDDSNHFLGKPMLNEKHKTSSFSNKIQPYKCDIEIDKANEGLCQEKMNFHCNAAGELVNNHFDKPCNSVSGRFDDLQNVEQSVVSQVPKQIISTKHINSCANVKKDSIPNNLSLLSEVASNQLVTTNSDVNKYNSTNLKRKYSPTKEVQGNCSPRLLRKNSVLTRAISPIEHSNVVKTCKNLNFSNIEESKYFKKDQCKISNHYTNRPKETKNTTHVKYFNKNTPGHEKSLNSALDCTNNEITVLKEVYITTPKHYILPHRVNRLSSTYKQSTENNNNRKTISSTIKTELLSKKGNTSFCKGNLDTNKSKPVDLTRNDSSVIDQSYKTHAKSHLINPNVCTNGKSTTTKVLRKTKCSPQIDHPGRKCFQDSYKTTTIKRTNSTSPVRNVFEVKNHSIQGETQLISTSQISIPPTKPCFVLLQRIDNLAKNNKLGLPSNPKLTFANPPSPNKNTALSTTSKFSNISPLNRNEMDAKPLNIGEQFDIAGDLPSDKSLGDVKSQLISESMEPASSLAEDKNNTDHQSSKEIFINYLQLEDVSSKKQFKKSEQVNASLKKLRSYKSYVDNTKASGKAIGYLTNKTKAAKDEIGVNQSQNAGLKTEETKLSSPSKPMSIQNENLEKPVLKRNLQTMHPQSNKMAKSDNFSQNILSKPKINKIIVRNNKIKDINIKPLELFEEIQIIEHSKTNKIEAISPQKTNNKFYECTILDEDVICTNNEQSTSLDNTLSTKFNVLDLTGTHEEYNKEDNENLEIIDLTSKDESKNLSPPKDCTKTNSLSTNSRKEIHKLLDPSIKQVLPVKPNSSNVESCNIKSPSKKLSKKRQKWLKLKYFNNLEYYKSSPSTVVNQFHDHISSNMSPPGSDTQIIYSNQSNNMGHKKTNVERTKNKKIRIPIDNDNDKNLNVEGEAKNEFKGRTLIDNNKDNGKNFDIEDKPENKYKNRTLLYKNNDKNINVEDKAKNESKGRTLTVKDNNKKLTAGVKCAKRAMGNRIIKRKNCPKNSSLYREKTCSKQSRKLRNSTTNSCTNGSKSPFKVISKAETKITEKKIRKIINRTLSTPKHPKFRKKKQNNTSGPIVKPVLPSAKTVNSSPIDVVVSDGDDICEVISNILSSKQKNNDESIKQIETTTTNNDDELTEIVYSLPSCRNKSSTPLSNNPLQNIYCNSLPQSVLQGNCNVFPWQYPMVVQHTSQNNIICSNFGLPYMFSPYQAQPCQWTGHQMNYNLGAVSSLPQPIALIPTQNNTYNTSPNVDSNINATNQDLVSCISEMIDGKSEIVNETVNNIAKQKSNDSTQNTKSNRLRTTNKKRIQPYYFRKKNHYSKLKRRKLSFSKNSSSTSKTKNIHCHNADNVIQNLPSNQLNSESNGDESDSSPLNSNLKRTTEEETILTEQYSSEVYKRDFENINEKDMCLVDNTLQLESRGLSVFNDSFTSETLNSTATSTSDTSVKICTDNLLNKVTVFNKKQMKILKKLSSEKLSHKIEFVSKTSL